MIDSDTTTSRHQKIKAVERIISLGRQTLHQDREARLRRLTPKTFQVAADEWRKKALEQLNAAAISEQWKSAINEAPPTHIGVKLALENLHVLKWRLRDRGDDTLSDDERKAISIQAWLDTWGSILVAHACRHNPMEHIWDECAAFATELRSATEAATNFASNQGQPIYDIMAKSVAIINNRYDQQSPPYQLRAVDAWHVGWAMMELAWLLADTAGRTLPYGNNRACTFPEAQAARITYRDTGIILCPRCGINLTPVHRARTLPRPDFNTTAAECKSCELMIHFPDQALPDSVWNGPRLSPAAKIETQISGSVDSSAMPPQEARPTHKPRIFIGSSVEGLNIADHIQLGLEHYAECTIWHQGVFGLSDGTLDSLIKAVKNFEFAVLVLTPDDLVHKRGTAKNSPRDNVLFELGLFMGALGRERTYIVYCRDEKPDLPTDLAGVTPATFAKRSDGNLQAALGSVCTQIRLAIGAAKSGEV
ncbi:TIR domain-containing protein [Sorangium sp. So ce834]|uniref:nucleotide-binding protein n=1 Tax=Sorangium sp. So ce834 TaxID=3133321 RepID=UPI003F6234E7